MAGNRLPALRLRRCVNAGSDSARGELCEGIPVATVTVSFPSGNLPDRCTFWCGYCLASLDFGGAQAIMPSASIMVRAS